MTDAASSHHAAETAARSSYGRLLAFLIARSHDVASAEDALADAFAAALKTWPIVGVPSSPEAWLMTTAKRRLFMGGRRQKVRDAFADAERALHSPSGQPERGFPDERLKLLFVCAHPALDAKVHVPLMLQTILGFEASQIASAFLTSPSAMAQRLVRAKAKLRDANVRFELPSGDDLEPRLLAVLEAIYAAYTLSLDGVQLTGDFASDMRHEALYLSRLVAQLMPSSSESLGLLALLLFCESRERARLSPEGEFVPLHGQDTSRWDRGMIAEAEDVLWRASAHRRVGPLQLEAAIQSAHCQGAFIRVVPWDAVARLYAALVALAPSVGSRVGHAIAVGESTGSHHGLRLLTLLEQDESERIATYQPFWVARAELEFRCGDRASAVAAMRRGIGLTERLEIRAFLLRRLAHFQM